MFQYRITKYDPALRVDGMYMKEEWTSVADIGKVFDGNVFTQDEYEKAEQNHIDCLLALLEMSGVENMRIQQLEKYEESSAWEENQLLDLSLIVSLIRDCLREKCWCQLCHAHTFIHFGYDYYIYFGTDLPYEQCDESCRRYGLFCEKYISPQMDLVP